MGDFPPQGEGGPGATATGSFSAGISTLGNTSGTSGIISNQLVFAGGNNITLSQSTNSNSGTITVSAFNQSVQTQDRFDLTLSGNTTGTLALISSGTMTLAGGNNITLSQAGNVVTISAAAIGAGSFSAGISTLGNTSGTTGTVSNQLVFAGGNNITLSQSTNAGGSGTITISAFTQSEQTQNRFDLTLSGNTAGALALISSGTLTLAGGNNITLSQAGNAVTISAAAIGAGSFSAGVSNLGNTSGTTGIIANQLVFAGGNNITLSQSTDGQSATITISAFSDTVTQYSAGMSNLGNTSGTTGLASQRLILVGGNNITLRQSLDGGSATLTISAIEDTVTQYSAGMSNLGNTSGTTGLASQRLILVGGNNITLNQSLDGGSASLTISAFNQSQQTQNIIRDVNILGNTSGTTAEITSGTLFLAGGNNITLSQNNNTITISAFNQSQQTQNIIRDVNIAGNTSGTTAEITSGTLSLAGGNNITLSQNANTITISSPNILSAGMSNLGNTSGTSGLVSQRLILVGGNNITLSQSTDGQSATLTISASEDTVTQYSAGISNLGNTSGTSGLASQRIVFIGGNNITLSQSLVGGSASLTISAFTQTEQTQNRFDLTLSGNTSGTLALVSSGTLTLVGGNNITLSQAGNAITLSVFEDTVTQYSAGISNIGNTSGTSGLASQRIVFAGGNNITLSQSLVGGSATLTISAFTQTEQTQNRFDLTLSGNTSGTLALVSSGTLTLAGGNNITLSQAGNAVTISAAAVGTGSFTAGISNIGNTSGTSDTVANRLIFAGGNNITLSQSKDGQSATITISAASVGAGSFTAGISNIGNTSGTSDTVANRLILAGGNNITLSQSKDGQSATITISAFTQTEQTQNRFDLTLSGNTSGTLALVSSGTLTLAGGNNITLSQAGNAITVSGGNSYSAGMSNLGNTSGTSGLASQRLVLVGGNNITLSQSTDGGSATLTISAFTQTEQTQNRFDLTLSGNTSGTLALVSSGTLTLVGGNNITLSQAGNAITLSVFEDSVTQYSAGISNIGNTSGTSGLASQRIVFAGGNNITLSQSLVGGSATLTISAFTQTEQTQNRFDLTLSGNTSGTLALVSSGTLTLAGGNNITLSQAGNAVTVSGGNSYSAGMSNLGNTSGTSGLVSQQLILVGGNNITLSQSTNAGSATLTISAFTQTEQTQNRFDLTLSGNTSGTLALVSSGTLTLVGGNNITLSQAGNAITLSVFADTVTQYSAGISNIGNTSGTSGLASQRLVLAGGNNITLSQSTDGGSATVTISAAAAGAVPTLTYWGNGDQTIDALSTSNGTFWLFPLNPSHDIFPGNMTANTALLNFSNADNAASRSFTHSWKIGIYTINSVSLSLLNSVATSWGSSADNATNNSLFSGERFLTIHSSAWSASPTFSQTQYFVGLVGNSAGNNVNFSIFGFRILKSDVVRSGTIGVSVSSGNTSMGRIPFIGVSSASRNITAGLPTSIQLSELVKTGVLYGFIPHIQFNNISSNF